MMSAVSDVASSGFLLSVVSVREVVGPRYRVSAFAELTVSTDGCLLAFYIPYEYRE